MVNGSQTVGHCHRHSCSWHRNSLCSSPPLPHSYRPFAGERVWSHRKIRNYSSHLSRNSFNDESTCW